jgi:hypothetical protein
MICNDLVESIKRVMTSNNFIIRTYEEGVKLLSINDLTSSKFSLQRLLDTKVGRFTDSLQVQITDSRIIIAATSNERINGKWKSSIQVRKVAIAEI